MALKGKLLKIYKKIVDERNITDIVSLTNIEKAIEYFAQNDPSKTYKYVESMLNISLNGTESNEAIIDIIKRFDSLLHKISPKIFNDIDLEILKQITSGVINSPKDIQQYKTYKDYELVVQLAEKYNTKKDKRDKIISEETDIIYDKDDYLIVVPLTLESSRYWGVATKWCTTSREYPIYYLRHTHNGTLFYIIDKYRQDDQTHPMGKLAIHIYYDENEKDAYIFNRFSNLICRDLNLVLPPHLVNLLMKYHKYGTLIDVTDILDEIKKIKFTNLGVEDEWNQTELADPSDPPGITTINFECAQFPSYRCSIKIDITSIRKASNILFQWINKTTNKIVFSTSLPQIKLRTIGLHIQKHTLFEFLNSLIKETLSPNTYTYIYAKKRMLNNVINNFFKVKHKDWIFTFNTHQLKNRCKSSSLNEKASSLINLGMYSYQVQGNFADLNNYSASVYLDFSSNKFILLAGQTDEIFWDEYYQDFNLVDFNEVNLLNILNQFVDWVIYTIQTKSEKRVKDLYDDNALQITSKTSAFNNYLKSHEKNYKIFCSLNENKEFVNQDYSDYIVITNDEKELLNDLDYDELPF